MPIKRKTGSDLGKAIVDDVKNFIWDNAKAMEGDTTAKPEDGAKALAHAIAYGIAKALSDTNVAQSFAKGVCPVGGDVVP